VKILFASTVYTPNVVGGAEKVVQTVAESLLERGHQPVVVTTKRAGDQETADVNGVKVHYVPLRNLHWQFDAKLYGAPRRAMWHVIDTYNMRMAEEFGKVLERERPDVVNTHNIAGFSPAIWSVIKARNVPLVHTMHDQYLLCPKMTMFDREKNCNKRCLKCLIYALPRKPMAETVDVVTSVSQFLLDRHRQFGYFRTPASQVIYNGLLPTADGDSSVRAPREGKMRFGFLGQIAAPKGLHVLIRAFAEEFADRAELWIAGKGDREYETELRLSTRELPGVRWLGFVNPSELLDQIDVLVVPSLWHDSAPLVILEAFGRQVPVIGSMRGGIPEFISAETGWLFDPDKKGSLNVAMRTCINVRDQLPLAGSSAYRVSKTFSRQKCVDGYLQAYEQAFVRSGSNRGS
jgi:glycosyltransferase involved in cell wall biosynthesis